MKRIACLFLALCFVASLGMTASAAEDDGYVGVVPYDTMAYQGSYSYGAGGSFQTSFRSTSAMPLVKAWYSNESTSGAVNMMALWLNSVGGSGVRVGYSDVAYVGVQKTLYYTLNYSAATYWIQIYNLSGNANNGQYAWRIASTVAELG